MKPLRLIGLLTALALTVSSPVTATEQETQSKYDEIIVTAAKTAETLRDTLGSIELVTNEEIERQGATSVADLLRDVPGIEVMSNSSPASKRVMIRGEGSERTLILVDGQKISENKSMDGAPLLIAPERIERIEVIKGPASVLYGSEAIGGVINIITKKDGDKPIQGTISETYNSATEGWDSFASVYGNYKQFGYRISGNYSDQGNIDTPAGTLDNSDFETQEFDAYLDYSWKNGKVGIAYDKYTSDINLYTPEGVVGYPLTAFQLDLPNWDREKYSAFIELNEISDTLVKAKANIYYQETVKQFAQEMSMSMSMQMGPPPAYVYAYDSTTLTENNQDTLGAEAQLDWMFADRLYQITGISYSKDQLDADSWKENSVTTNTFPPMMGFDPVGSTINAYNYKAQLDTYAIYMQHEWTLPADFTLTYGGRYTWVDSELSETTDPDINRESSSDSHPVFSAGLTWSGIDGLTLRTLFGQGYRTAYLQELYIGTIHGGYTVTLPNHELDPETSNNFEIGARYENYGLYFDLAAFKNFAKDYITTEEIVGATTPTSQYQNIDEAETTGVEISAGYTIANTALTPYVSGTWIQRKFDNGGVSTQKTGLPRFKGRYGIRYDKDLNNADVSLFIDLYGRSASSAEEQFSDGSVEKYASWETANMTIGSYFGAERQYRIDVNLNNIFDREYQTASSNIPESSTHAMIKFSATF
ncbi:hemoglobin/transferrin/lactoferrin receptor protein [Desulfuromusa kysingii]|uniref:Hemoglobin/transferrin/lactoferrin receptor protein n=1 Tax=Desulfuromusa kysingii TaxID=37625 RepID=A0A1H3VSB8_9BACT|nr:TonB-dependent receptor [Desulfuromusa kysingii]SDZ77715.1 hemoglobin/transferrin/lactoferrin receptor protein [Desulfuromusa kysingii]